MKAGYNTKKSQFLLHWAGHSINRRTDAFESSPIAIKTLTTTVPLMLL